MSLDGDCVDKQLHVRRCPRLRRTVNGSIRLTHSLPSGLVVAVGQHSAIPVGCPHPHTEMIDVCHGYNGIDGIDCIK